MAEQDILWQLIHDGVVGSTNSSVISGKIMAKAKKYFKNNIEQDVPVYREVVNEEYQEWVPVIVYEVQQVATYAPEENHLTANSLNLEAFGGYTSASATAKEPKTVGLATGGSLKTDAASNGSFSAVFEGMSAEIAGQANIDASSRTGSTVTGATPGKLTLLSASSSENTARVGERDDRHTVAVIIGKDASLTADWVGISAVNNGHAEADMKQGGSMALASISKSSQPTESWYDTLISVGENAKITSNTTLIIRASDLPSTISKVEANTAGFGLNFDTMMGKNFIDQECNIDVGNGAVLTADGDISLEVIQQTKADASTRLNGGGILSGKDAKAMNDIVRIARINIGEDATIQRAKENESTGTVTLSVRSGYPDTIRTEAYIESAGFIALANARAYTDVESYGEINIAPGANITGGNGVTVDARSTSNYGIKYIDGKLGVDPGIITKATVKSKAGIPVPNAVARNTLSFNTYVNINQEDPNHPAPNRGRASISTDSGDILVNASNDAMSVKADASSEGKGGFGVSTGNAWNDAWLTNAIWIDRADLAGKNINIYAENGGQLKTSSNPYADEHYRPRIVSHGYSKLNGIGKAASEARITGEMINQIRSENTGDVNFIARNGGQVIHKTTNPEDAIDQEAKAESKIKKVMGIPLGKRQRKSVLEWGIWNRCDFCGEGEEYDVQRTEQKTIAERYKDAFEKALSPLTDIQRMVSSLGSITRARYGEEDYAASGKIFVLDLPVTLEKDISLNNEQISRYRLWDNTATRLDVYLLPNATRMYGIGDLNLQFVSEVLRGDVRNNGETVEIDIITALTPYAVSHPVIPIGSTGALDFATGTLTLPSKADFELYLHELSAKWLTEAWNDGYFQALTADQGAINDCALNGAEMPAGEIVADLTDGGEANGWHSWWIGATPATASDPDQTLICLLTNAETDEADAFRTSVSMIKNGEEPVDVSLYLYRDRDSDRLEIEKYNVMFFDTPEGEKSLVKVITNLTTGGEMEVPLPMHIVLRGTHIDGTDWPAYSLSDHWFAMCDGSDGRANMFDGFYTNTFDGDTFDSNYIRIEGIADGNLKLTVRKGQSIWTEWTGENEAENIAGEKYIRVENEWYPEAEAPTGPLPEDAAAV